MTTAVHAERTVQDIIDDMSPDERELMDLIVGAAVADEVIDDDDIVAEAEALSEEQRQAIDYIVGGILAQEEASLEQANLMVGEFLEHYGVKGMKWGIRNVDRPAGGGGGGAASKSQKPPKLVGSASTVKLSNSTMNTRDERKAARKEVRRGTATATEAHVAALKSTGHRVANAFLGDKTYWKGVAITAGVAGAVAMSPAVLPASALAVIGSAVTGSSVGAAAAGGGVLTGAAGAGAYLTGGVLQVTNIYRAIAGNTKVDESYARLASNVSSNYDKGMKRTAKVLRKHGGLSGRKTKRALKQSDLTVGEFLSHFDGVTLGQVKQAV